MTADQRVPAGPLRPPMLLLMVVWFGFGYFSLLGSSIWLIAGTATLAAAVFARKVLGSKFSDESPYRIIVMGGAIGFVMALDDILLFHDAGARSLGIPEIVFHYFYVLCFAGLLIFSRKVFRLTPWPILFASLAGFGISTGIDIEFSKIINSWFSSQSEDVYKFCGVVLWAFYFLYVSWAYLGQAGKRKQSGQEIDKRHVIPRGPAAEGMSKTE